MTMAPMVVSCTVYSPVHRDAVVPCWENDMMGAHDDCYGLMDFDKPIVIGHQETKTARVLVCAPSNSALDEIIYRIMTT